MKKLNDNKMSIKRDWIRIDEINTTMLNMTHLQLRN